VPFCFLALAFSSWKLPRTLALISLHHFNSVLLTNPSPLRSSSTYDLTSIQLPLFFYSPPYICPLSFLLLSFGLMDDYVSSQDDIQVLIEEIEALGWDNPVLLETHDGNPASREGFAFIGKLLALKPLNTYHVRQTLSSIWSFATPLSMEVLSSNKFLFTVPHEDFFTCIMNQGPWNVRGSLLHLQPWSPSIAIDEVKLIFCPF
jgi:hypothetical protein